MFRGSANVFTERSSFKVIPISEEVVLLTGINGRCDVISKKLSKPKSIGWSTPISAAFLLSSNVYVVSSNAVINIDLNNGDRKVIFVSPDPLEYISSTSVSFILREKDRLLNVNATSGVPAWSLSLKNVEHILSTRNALYLTRRMEVNEDELLSYKGPVSLLAVAGESGAVRWEIDCEYNPAFTVCEGADEDVVWTLSRGQLKRISGRNGVVQSVVSNLRGSPHFVGRGELPYLGFQPQAVDVFGGEFEAKMELYVPSEGRLRKLISLDCADFNLLVEVRPTIIIASSPNRRIPKLDGIPTVKEVAGKMQCYDTISGERLWAADGEFVGRIDETVFAAHLNKGWYTLWSYSWRSGKGEKLAAYPRNDLR